MMERKLGPQFRFRKNRPARKMDFIQSVSRPTIDFDIHHIMALMGFRTDELWRTRQQDLEVALLL
jgi:hypothetical protein